MRKTTAIVSGLYIAILLQIPVVKAQVPTPKVRASLDGLALTPPMGWYPWNEFGQEPQNEKLVKEIVDALISSGMKDAGYEYVGPDEGICFYRGVGGKLTTNLQRYPSGLRALGDYIHHRGLKYALYTDAGVRTCSKAMPGTEDHEVDDMAAFADWRTDYLKVDWCWSGALGHHSLGVRNVARDEVDVDAAYAKLRDAQLVAGRPMVFSLCSWGVGEPWKWAAWVGHLWRTTGDIAAPGKADWVNAMKNATLNEKLYAAAGPGHWNDPDLLINGMSGLSDTQNRSFFSLWCIMAAPLMASNDLRKMTPHTIQVLTNPEAIGVNQDPLGIQGHIVRREGDTQIWAAKRLYDGSQAVLVFNTGTAAAEVQVDWGDIGLENSAMYVRNLWTHETSGPHWKEFAVTVEPGEVAFLRFAKTKDFPLPPVIVADSYQVAFHAAGNAPQKLTQAITVKTNGSSELPLWKVAPGLPAWLSVKVKKNGKSQTFSNQVSTAGLAKGVYHAIVRADNHDPVSGYALSALYYDVDLEVGSAPGAHAGR